MPPRPLSERAGKMHTTGLRLTAERRALLEAAASQAGRSLTAEMERRLDLSFEWETAFAEARDVLKRANEIVKKQVESALRKAGVHFMRDEAGELVITNVTRPSGFIADRGTTKRVLLAEFAARYTPDRAPLDVLDEVLELLPSE